MADLFTLKLRDGLSTVVCKHPDCFFEEGAAARLACSVDQTDCGYSEGSDGEHGWKNGWKRMDELLCALEPLGYVFDSDLEHENPR